MANAPNVKEFSMSDKTVRDVIERFWAECALEKAAMNTPACKLYAKSFGAQHSMPVL